MGTIILKYVEFNFGLLAKVVESLTRNVPGGAFLNKFIASSRDNVGLYQYFEESRANLF